MILDPEGKPLPPPTKGDIVDCSIIEEGDIKNFSGVVVSVNVSRKSMKVQVKPGSDWEAQNERYKFSVSPHPSASTSAIISAHAAVT